jgi:fructose-1,6-bisphosphatase/inositol monophosphatase family enzyme
MEVDLSQVDTLRMNTLLSQTELEQLQVFTMEIADATRELILDLWHGRSFQETLKSDQTPVTLIDLKAEELARKMIVKRFPNHGIMGEEYASINPESEFQWTIDPIDGTQNLINLIPTFGTLIGLRFRGKAILGLIDHPVLDLRTVGGTDLGVWHNGSKVSLPDVAGNQLSPNDLVVTNNRAVFGRSAEFEHFFSKSMSFHPHTRIYYDCYSHTLALLGRVAVVVEPNLKIWDVTPVEAMMTELGGGFVPFGESDASFKPRLISAVFGKRNATAWMSDHLGLPNTIV